MNSQQILMNIALEYAKLSHCVSYQVACLAVRNKRIVVSGINGTKSGLPNCCEVFKDYNPADTIQRELHHKFSERHEIHAEMNVIIFAANNGISLKDCDIYCTLFPCNQCLKNLSMLEIKNIFYHQDYDKTTDKDDIIKQFKETYNINIIQI